MKLIPWSNKHVVHPFGADWDQWMDEFFKGAPSHLPEAFQRAAAPAVNLAESASEFIATVELPGVSEADISVQIVGRQLVISGERKWEEEKKEKEFFRVESQYGAFRRVVPLPDGLDTSADKVRANLDKGVLEVRIPRHAAKPASTIRVQAAK